MASLYSNDPKYPLHICIGHIYYPLGQLFSSQIHIATHTFYSRFNRLQVELHSSPKKIFRMNTAKKEICIRNRQSCSPLAITDRTRNCSCAFRPYFLGSPRIYLCYRASSRSYGTNVDHRDTNRQTTKLSLYSHCDLTINKRDISR